MATQPDSLAEAVTQVRALIKEPTALFWTDAELENWIKEACVDICAKTLCYKAVASSQAFTNSLIEYLVPALSFKRQFHRILSCSFYDSQTTPVSYRGLVRIHPRQLEHTDQTSSGDPQYWYQFEDRIGIYPVPSSIHANDRLIVHYALSTETITNLPDRFQTFVIPYAAAMALLKRRRNQSAISLYTSYLNSVKLARTDLENIDDVDTKDMLQIPDFTVREQ